MCLTTIISLGCTCEPELVLQADRGLRMFSIEEALIADTHVSLD